MVMATTGSNITEQLQGKKVLHDAMVYIFLGQKERFML
jgi:hypothetical protein